MQDRGLEVWALIALASRVRPECEVMGLLSGVLNLVRRVDIVCNVGVPGEWGVCVRRSCRTRNMVLRSCER